MVLRWQIANTLSLKRLKRYIMINGSIPVEKKLTHETTTTKTKRSLNTLFVCSLRLLYAYMISIFIPRRALSLFPLSQIFFFLTLLLQLPHPLFCSVNNTLSKFLSLFLTITRDVLYAIGVWREEEKKEAVDEISLELTLAFFFLP